MGQMLDILTTYHFLFTSERQNKGYQVEKGHHDPAHHQTCGYITKTNPHESRSAQVQC